MRMGRFLRLSRTCRPHLSYSSSSSSSTLSITRTLSLLTYATTTAIDLKQVAIILPNKILQNSLSFSAKQPTFLICNCSSPSLLTSRLFSTSSFEDNNKDHISKHDDDPLQYETREEGDSNGWDKEFEVEPEVWEEEEEVEPEIGDGGDGGGIVLQGVPWGEQALSIAHEVLMRFGDDMKLFSFKTTPRGYVYVRLDKMTNKYGCPSMEELESYCQQYKKRLDEVGALGEIPDDLALEVSSPGAERLLKVPDDLSRFRDMPMRVCYLEDVQSNCQEKDGVFFLESVETESENCVWKLADVKENRDPGSKGRPLSHKKRAWRITLPFDMHKRITLYLEF